MNPKENLDSIFFYTLEKSIKVYRQFAQRIINEAGFNITIDQWLVIKALDDHPEQTQHEIAETVFKDYASLTRMIETLVQKKYLERSGYPNDRRRFQLTLTSVAHDVLKNMQPLIENNRSVALKGITKDQAVMMRGLLNQIIENCDKR